MKIVQHEQSVETEQNLEKSANNEQSVKGTFRTGSSHND